MAQPTRLDELRRRVDKDPASIAFASLAEELRKAGHFDEAVQVCRAGLEHHSAYLSARVTLGRALLALQQYGEARTEIEYVLHAAPDNLLALKCLNELQGLDGDAAPQAPEPAEAGPHVQPTPEPPEYDLRIQTAPEPPKVEAPIAVPVAAVAHELAPRQPLPVGSHSDPTEATTAASPHGTEVSASPNGGPPAEQPTIAELAEWQARIQADRTKRTGGSL